MEIASLVIWFNPTIKEVNNILTYNKYLERTYIIDNSDNDNSELASKINNVTYYPLLRNTGIAYALNRGFEKAIQDKVDWVMTMDQDSIWEDEQIKEYITWAKQIIEQNDRIVSLAPFAKIKNKSWAGVIFWPIVLKLTKPKGVKFVDKVICSSNIVSVNAWSKVNGFNEKMFIDEVDFEFCYKLRSENLLIVQNYDISFKHTIGGGKRTILPWTHNHSDFRLYYILRNKMYIIKKYPSFAKKYKYSKVLKAIIRDTCIFDINRKQHRLILEKAKKDCAEMLNYSTPDSTSP